MASRPSIEQHFEDAIGIDYVSSDLTRPTRSFKSLKNFTRGKGRALRGRIGCQNMPPGGFLSFHNYTYQDLSTGATVEEMIAINDHLWKLKVGTLTVSSGVNLNHRISLNTATSTYRFVLNSQGTPYTLAGNPYFDLGSGTEAGASLVTVEALRAAIDTHASLVCSRPADLEFAQVNGNQAGVSTITVFAGHTLAVGDYIQFWDYLSGKLTWRIITATTATTITFDSSWGTVTVQGNQILGPLGSTAASIPVNDAYVSINSSINFSFYYWDPVQHVTGKYPPFKAFWASRNHANWRHACFENADNKVYIFTEAPGQTLLGHESYPHYYDGLKVARAGVPKIEGEFNATSGGLGGLAAGTYKYRARFVKKDKNGIYYYGQPDDLNITVVHPGGSSITVDVPTPKYAGPSTSKAVVNGNQVGVSTIVVVAGHYLNVGDPVILLNQATATYVEDVVSAVNKSTNTITISSTVNVNNGDKICAKYAAGFDDRSVTGWGGPTNNASSSPILLGDPIRVGETVFANDLFAIPSATPRGLQERVLTASSPTSITWSGTTINLGVTTLFSTSMWVEVYRTKSGGNKYYLIARIPIFNGIGVLGVYDAIADASLGLDGELDEPEIGYELDLPPRAAIGCLHQGVMCYSRINGEPNSVGFSDVTGGLEAVPLASNYFDIPSNVEGAISAIASDNDAGLAVFKPRAYYDCQGDFQTGTIIARPVKEKDYGISSQASVVKIDGMVVGIGPLGPMAVQGGRRVPEFGMNIRPAFKGNSNINVNRAVAVNDNTTEQYLCWVPATLAATGNQLMFMYDYGLDRQWFNWSFSDGYDPGGGMVVWSGNLYHLCLQSLNSIGGRPYRRHNPLVDVAQRHADNHTLIQYQIRSTPHHDGKPSIDKVWKALKIFSMYSQFDSAEFTTCELSIKTYRNFQETTAHTTTLKTFSSATEFEKEVTLLNGKARSLQFLIENTTILQCPHISGYELMFPEPYPSEDIRRR